MRKAATNPLPRSFVREQEKTGRSPRLTRMRAPIPAGITRRRRTCTGRFAASPAGSPARSRRSRARSRPASAGAAAHPVNASTSTGQHHRADGRRRSDDRHRADRERTVQQRDTDAAGETGDGAPDEILSGWCAGQHEQQQRRAEAVRQPARRGRSQSCSRAARQGRRENQRRRTAPPTRARGSRPRSGTEPIDQPSSAPTDRVTKNP